MTVTFDRDGTVSIITIRRPHRKNAVDAAAAENLADIFKDQDRDESVSVMILTGEGGSFCSGADLQELAVGTEMRVAPDGDGPMGPTRLQLSKPTIAAIEGPAVAGGLELALWCDLRVVASDAELGVYCRRFGVPLMDLGTVRLPRLIGHSRAMDLILTGRGIDGIEAERIGLANRVTAPGEALGVAVDLAKQLSAFPQTCVRNDRISAIEQWGLSWDEATANEFRHGQNTLASGESFEGAAKFAYGLGRHGSTIPGVE